MIAPPAPPNRAPLPVSVCITLPIPPPLPAHPVASAAATRAAAIARAGARNLFVAVIREFSNARDRIDDRSARGRVSGRPKSRSTLPLALDLGLALRLDLALRRLLSAAFARLLALAPLERELLGPDLRLAALREIGEQTLVSEIGRVRRATVLAVHVFRHL